METNQITVSSFDDTLNGHLQFYAWLSGDLFIRNQEILDSPRGRVPRWKKRARSRSVDVLPKNNLARERTLFIDRIKNVRTQINTDKQASAKLSSISSSKSPYFTSKSDNF